MTRNEMEILAVELSDAAWRAIDKPGEDEARLAHYRSVVVVGLAIKRVNSCFDPRKWLRMSVPGSWRMEAHEDETGLALNALESGSLRVWDEQRAVRNSLSA